MQRNKDQGIQGRMQRNKDQGIQGRIQRNKDQGRLLAMTQMTQGSQNQGQGRLLT